MEFSSIWYFSFWSLISIVFSTTGIYALHKETSIPGSGVLVLCFAQSVSCSISYAFLFRPALEELGHQELQDAPSNKIFLNFFGDFATMYSPLVALASSTYFAFSRNGWNSVDSVWGICWLVSAVLLSRMVVKSTILGFKYSQTIGNFFTGFAGPLRMYPYHTLSWVLLQVLLSFSVTSPLLLGSISFILTSASIPSSFFLIDTRFKKLIATSSVAAYVYQQRRFVEIVCGMLANTLAQYYFRVQSLPLMLAFLSFAIAWLGNLANVQPSTDFGIFQFFVSMSVQSAVCLFGLHFYTFLVVLGGIAMMVLRWKMESVSLRHFGKQDTVVRDWQRLEELYGNGIDLGNQTRLSVGAAV